MNFQGQVHSFVHSPRLHRSIEAWEAGPALPLSTRGAVWLGPRPHTWASTPEAGCKGLKGQSKARGPGSPAGVEPGGVVDALRVTSGSRVKSLRGCRGFGSPVLLLCLCGFQGDEQRDFKDTMLSASHFCSGFSFTCSSLKKCMDVCMYFFVFLGPHLRRMEVPRLEVKPELQLPACTTATATPDPSLVCDLHRSSPQCPTQTHLTH